MIAAQTIDLSAIFQSAPLIYSILGSLSIASVGLWFYGLISFREKEIMPPAFAEELRKLLVEEQYDKAHALCTSQKNILSSLMKMGLTTRMMGPQIMLDSIKSEGKRASTTFWQRLTLLNDIVVVAPMLGLLGTVIGMFYAFYDVNRSTESINALFDGLGIAVGTTVMGLIVAILAMIFQSTLKYRIVRTLTLVENEALHLSSLIRR